MKKRKENRRYGINKWAAFFKIIERQKSIIAEQESCQGEWRAIELHND